MIIKSEYGISFQINSSLKISQACFVRKQNEFFKKFINNFGINKNLKGVKTNL